MRHEREREADEPRLRDFDEKAYLSGKVGIFGDAPASNKQWKPKGITFKLNQQFV